MYQNKVTVSHASIHNCKMAYFHLDEPFHLNSPWNFQVFHTNGKRSTTPEKNCSFIPSRIVTYCENTSSCGNYRILSFFFRAAYLIRGPRATLADQGPGARSPVFELYSVILKVGTCNFTINERNIKAIFRRYFSSLRYDSGKIFTITIFSSQGSKLTFQLGCPWGNHFFTSRRPR